jgi:HEAT repeat protein
MSFYDLSPDKRAKLVEQIETEIYQDLLKRASDHIHKYFIDEDTYIRKSAYLAIGRIYFNYREVKETVIDVLAKLFNDPDFKVRQTVINALGEIGKREDKNVWDVFEKGLKDQHHSVRNAVIGSLKKMGEKNPKPVLSFSKKHLHNPNPEIRRQVIHGVELRGRTHPEEVLPLLKEVQDEQNDQGLFVLDQPKYKRVRNIVVHVIGQISYKKDCLEKVIAEIKTWNNKHLVNDAIKEILETHKSYEKFSEKSYNEAQEYLNKNFNRL